MEIYEKGTFSQKNFEKVLRMINPNANVKIVDQTIFTNKKSLDLPETFYSNEKNGITNKHKSPTGQYVCYDARYIPKILFAIVKHFNLWDKVPIKG